VVADSEVHDEEMNERSERRVKSARVSIDLI
jgi:hypothetical protein